MRKRIFWNIFLSSLIAALLLGGVVLLVQYRSLETLMFSELSTECKYVELGLSSASDEQVYLDGLPSSNRVTLIAVDGTVLFDNSSDVSKLDNHASRPEIVAAKTTGD